MAASAAPPAPSRPPLLGVSYRASARIARALPPGLRYAAAGPGGAAWFWLSAAQRRAALGNYAAALGRQRDDPEVARVAKRAFQNYGRMLVDFLLLGSLSKDEVLGKMSTDGREHLDEALAKGRGAIMALPHMGSWDMAGAYAAALGYPVLTVAERFPGSLNDAIVATRNGFGMGIVPIGRAAVRAIGDQLKANGIVALVCDLEQGPGVSVSFFGRRAVVPAGPAAFALKTGAALIPVSLFGSGLGRYHGHVDPPLAYDARETKESLMQRVVHRFEKFIREHPDQWYAFRPMFSR